MPTIVINLPASAALGSVKNKIDIFEGGLTFREPKLKQK